MTKTHLKSPDGRLVEEREHASWWSYLRERWRWLRAHYEWPRRHAWAALGKAHYDENTDPARPVIHYGPKQMRDDLVRAHEWTHVRGHGHEWAWTIRAPFNFMRRTDPHDDVAVWRAAVETAERPLAETVPAGHS